MSNSEKMRRLHEKMLDRALTAFMSPTEKAAHFADTGEKAADLDEARWVMENVQGVVSAKDEPESPKVGSNAAPPASDVDALALKSAKEMLVKLGHANVTDETAAAFRDWKAEDWETWKRLKGPFRLGAYYILDCRPPAGDTLLKMKKEGLDLFMAQGFPSLDETLDVLVRRGRPIGAGALLRAMGFPDLARVATESFPCAGSAKGADKNGRKHEVLVEGARMRDSFVALFRWNEAADASNKVCLPDTISAKSLCEFACSRDGLASEAPAPKKVRYGLLGPSALSIVETADGIPVAITVRDFAPGPLLGTMLHVVAMCFRLGITDLYGDSYREKDINHALSTIATFMRGEALHGISEADRASFLRMATTIEWPRAYTIPTLKALPALF